MGDLVDGFSSIRRYLSAEKAKSTRKSYASDFSDFRAWCDAAGVSALPADPATAARYLANLADRGMKAATIARRVSAIRYAHVAGGHEPPTNAEGVKAVIRGIRRVIGVAQNRKAPVTAAVITAMLEHVPSTGVVGARDRALLLIGFAAALRRSELAGLKVGDLERQADGVIVHIRHSKTDQVAEGHAIAVPRGAKLRPVEALEAWLAISGITEGAVFRRLRWGRHVGADALCDQSVADIIKRYALAAGLDPAVFSGHSLRTGFVTSALESGADVLKVMDVTRHRDVKTLKVYDRRAKAFRNHAGKDFL